MRHAASPKPVADFRIEQTLLANGHFHVCGVDEAGRGPLAGPVVAAAVILDPEAIPQGLADSKALSERARERLYRPILETARAVSICSVSAETIDRINILEATLTAMTRAVEGLAISADHVLIDGNRVPHALATHATPIIGGDGRSVSIAAASIIAKVTRDRMMQRVDPFAPSYGLAGHKGYGTRAHRDTIRQKGGVRRLHRYSFAPLRDNSSE